jgi:hypothetical protein
MIAIAFLFLRVLCDCKMEGITLDGPKLQIAFETYLRQLGGLGPERLEPFVGFKPGSSELVPHMGKVASRIVKKLIRHSWLVD